MTIYTRKKGEYVALSREQVRRLRRTEQVIALQKDAQQLARTMRALTSWMGSVQRKALRMDATDLVVTRLPNLDRLLSMCDRIDKDVKELGTH